MSKGTFPRVVTLVDTKNHGHAGVYMLLAEGPKNYRVQFIREAGEYQAQERLWEKDGLILIEGAHPGLVKRVQEARQGFDEACREWDQERSEAIWKFRQQYDIDHPMPSYETPEKITATYRRELAEMVTAMAAQS